MPVLDGVRGIHEGRAAVVMGSGPSLSLLRDRKTLVWGEFKNGTRLLLPDISEPDRIKKHVTIAINDAVLKVPDADYYVTADPGMTRYNHWDALYTARCLLALPSDGFRRTALRAAGLPDERTVIFDRRADRGNYIMKTSDRQLVFGPSSAHCAINFAVVLGCSPIYLLGCGCRCGGGGKKYFWEMDGQPGPGGTKTGYPTFWLSEHASIGEKVEAGQYDQSYRPSTGSRDSSAVAAWEGIAAANPSVDIRDASGGLLSTHGVFPYVEIGKVYAQ